MCWSDGRGATTTFAYNGRHLPTSITYGIPGGVAATPNVSFAYNAAGNRTSMTDGLGSVSYAYNQLSQLTSETRTFTGVGSFVLSYQYNLAGELTSITNHWGVQVGYNYDRVGRVTSVSGANYAGVSSYVNNISYSAFGAAKQVSYANGRTLSLQYNNRLFLTRWDLPNPGGGSSSTLQVGSCGLLFMRAVVHAGCWLALTAPNNPLYKDLTREELRESRFR
jgi:YD repeat-containing protein